MRHKELRGSVDDQRARLAEENEFKVADALQREATIEYVRQRTKTWRKLSQGDLWIAIGIYLVLASVAFVAI
jgi:hypothetical protein